MIGAEHLKFQIQKRTEEGFWLKRVSVSLAWWEPKKQVRGEYFVYLEFEIWNVLPFHILWNLPCAAFAKNEYNEKMYQKCNTNCMYTDFSDLLTFFSSAQQLVTLLFIK